MSREKIKKSRNSEIFIRIDKLRQKFNLTQTAFAEKTNISRVTYTDFKTGKVGLSGELIVGISKAFPEVNINWIITGEGEMIESKINKVNEKSAQYHVIRGTLKIPEEDINEAINELSKLPDSRQKTLFYTFKGKLEGNE
jgi:transcriptional regulator with XRE-family HTH domain